MFARIATFEDVDVNRIDEVENALRKHSLPQIKELSGWSGSVSLVNPDKRQVLAISFFQTKEDIEAAQPTFERMPSLLPDEIREIVAGHRRSVDIYKVQLQEGVQLYEQTAAAVH